MSDDWHAIETLIMTYAERVDLGDFAGVADLFDGATYRSALGDDVMVQEGRDAVLNTFETLVRRYPDGTPRTKHVTTNVMVEVDGDTATARSYYTVMQQTEVLALQPIICGRYHDAFAKQGGAWCFTDRLIFSDLIGDLSQHLTVDFFGAEETEGMST
jgi:SnoaL-like protein